MDSNVSPPHGEQEKGVWNGHSANARLALAAGRQAQHSCPGKSIIRWMLVQGSDLDLHTDHSLGWGRA